MALGPIPREAPGCAGWGCGQCSVERGFCSGGRLAGFHRSSELQRAQCRAAARSPRWACRSPARPGYLRWAKHSWCAQAVGPSWVAAGQVTGSEHCMFVLESCTQTGVSLSPLPHLDVELFSLSSLDS